MTCLEVIQEHIPTDTTQRPKFCHRAVCRATWKDNPICARCRKPLWGKLHPATRYHEECRLGCYFCGGHIPTPQTTKREYILQPLYCSKSCRNAAWEGQPLPTCPQCEQPVDFEDSSTTWRNPPLFHNKCNPQSRRQRKLAYVNKDREFDYWSEVYTLRYTIPDQELLNELTGLPHPPPRPFTKGQVFEDDTPDPDYAPMIGANAFEWEIVDTHPLKPREKVDPYNRPWEVKQKHWEHDFGPYAARYVMYIPWHEGDMMIDLNPTKR